MKAVCIKTWCEPGSNFTFQKGFDYDIDKIEGKYITVIDSNSSPMSKGGRHLMNMETFKLFFKLMDVKQ